MRDTWDAINLDEFVAECDALGGISTPQAREAVRNFQFKPQAKVDVTLDPFSEAYFQQQLEVYAEISGRALDQASGEVYPFDVDARLNTANPYGVNDIAFISKHSRTVLTALMLANPAPGARVLDMGAGWGLSSEVMAFAGAEVTAVDINPDSVELINRRSARSGLPITAIQGNFDTVEPGSDFDIAIFYECLHHAVRPVDTLKRVAGFLGPKGRIVFAGEPINTLWWPNWGMRLDAESVYAMRKFGWFESGWSADFICECIRQAGFEPTMIPGVGIDGGDVCVASRKGVKETQADTAASLSLAQPSQFNNVAEAEREVLQLQAKLAKATSDLQHARRYPWKYLRQAFRMRR